MQVNLIHNGIKLPLGEGDSVSSFLYGWAKDQLDEAIQNLIMEGVAAYLAQVVLALPVLAVILLSIWFFFQMFSKGFAKFSVWCALIYGLIVIAL